MNYNSFKNSLNNETAETKVTFQCSICGKKHASVVNRAECELKCYKKQEEEKRLAAAKKKQAEHAARKKEVDEAIAHAEELKNKYIQDYGAYTRVHTCNADDLDKLFDVFRRMP